MKKVTIVVPCYNEEEALPLYFKAVDPVISRISDFQFDFILIDDGSKDHTWDVMNRLYVERKDVTILKESKNFGQQNALFTALLYVKGDYVITMDVDLQDPVELIKDICQKFSEGYDMVNPKRACRKEDSFMKRTTAGMFYRLVNRLEGKEVIPENVNNYRGMSRRVIDTINAMPEKDKNVITMASIVGFKTCEVDFSRAKRDAGTTKYSFKRLFQVAFDIISTCTSRPLYFPVMFGGFFSALFSVSSLVLFILYLCAAAGAIGGYGTIVLWMVISFIMLGFSVLCLFVGIIGVYLRSVLINSRSRPMAIVDVVKTKEEKENEQ